MLELVALDTTDAARLASFYAALTGWDVVRDVGDWVTLRAGDGQEVAFQRVPSHVPPQWPGQELPQQFHLDLLVESVSSAVERAESLGAVRLGDGPSWVTLADPSGHPFDLCRRDGFGPGVGLYAVTVDAPDASALARFYAALLGMEVTYDGPEGAMVAGYGKTVLCQQVASYNPPVWGDPARPQQAHFDVLVSDLAVASELALGLGATRLDGGGDGWGLFADPAGHPFDLTTG
jgi:catechol-2,3-dioxygenase